MILNDENYYSDEANRKFMSVSQYKDFLTCEAAALARLDGRYKQENLDCFTIGSYVHAAIDGPEAIELFRREHPEIYSSRGATKGELKAEYKHADLMIETILNDELCAQMLEGEKEVIISAELFGVLWKAKVDVLAIEDGRMTDLKTVKEIKARFWNEELRKWDSFVERFGYTIQMAVYTELERVFNHRFERLEPFIVAVSKEEVPDKEIICFDDEALQEELQKVKVNLPRVIAVKEGIEEPRRCGKCKYCRQTKKAKIIHFANLLEG